MRHIYPSTSFLPCNPGIRASEKISEQEAMNHLWLYLYQNRYIRNPWDVFSAKIGNKKHWFKAAKKCLFLQICCGLWHWLWRCACVAGVLTHAALQLTVHPVTTLTALHCRSCSLFVLDRSWRSALRFPMFSRIKNFMLLPFYIFVAHTWQPGSILVLLFSLCCHGSQRDLNVKCSTETLMCANSQRNILFGLVCLYVKVRLQLFIKMHLQKRLWVVFCRNVIVLCQSLKHRDTDQAA